MSVTSTEDDIIIPSTDSDDDTDSDDHEAPSETPSRFKPVRPVLRWPGGKKNLVRQYAPMLLPREKFTRFHEPTVGGGAMLFLHAYEAERLFLNDALPEVCALYTAIKDDVERLTDKALLLAGKIVQALKTGGNDDAWAEFRTMRGALSEWRVRGDSVSTEAAAWMLVLNRTAINGLHRVSRKGQCNMPFRKDLLDKAISGKVTIYSLVRPAHLLEAHKLLTRTDATITQGDFADQELLIEKGDYVFFDPPYDPCPKKVLEGKPAQSFTAYTADGFSDADHKRLADELDRIHDSGAFFTLTARATPTTRERYGKWNVHTISMRHNISPKNEGREAVMELLVTNIRPSDTLTTP